MSREPRMHHAGPAELAAWRTLLGHSAALWAGHGRHVVDTDLWIAISGAAHVDYNVLVVHGGDVDGGVARTLEEVRDAGVPALVMVAGAGLGAVQALAAAGWVCAGATSLMVLRDAGGVDDPAVRRLGVTELPEARGIITQAFDVSLEDAAVALPDDAGTAPGLGAWGLDVDGSMASCVATATVDGAVGVWSMATPALLRRRGHGRRLMSAVLARCAAEARARSSVLYASPAGVPLYESLGYEVVEYWQIWSRPRWVLGRA